ncbi:MAG: TldD/PmbA family protein [Candidatus Methanofastidiosia archaeon]|jgi:PmbA protein
MDIRDTVSQVVKDLGKNNVVEAFYADAKEVQISIRNSEILTQNIIKDAGVGIRVCLENKTGFACTNTITLESVRETGEKAIKIARVSSEVSDFALPFPGVVPEVKGLYDPKVADITIDEAVDTAYTGLTAAENVDPRVTVKGGIILFSFKRRGIINSYGINYEEPGTRAVVYLGGVGEYNGSVTGTCSEVAFSCTADVDADTVGVKMGEKVLNQMNPQSVDSFEGTVLFAPEAVSYQLAEMISDAVNADAVLKKRSQWADSLDSQVASNVLTMYDNGILPGGFSSRQFDDEGTPSQKTVLIEKGVLQTFLHNATTANALSMENTGNASRDVGGFDLVRNIIGTGYRTEPEIYPSNLMIHPGTYKKEDLISEVKKGVLVESMAGFPQKGSGIISAQLDRAFFIRNGEIQYPIKGGMVSGAGYDWVKTIDAVGNDVKQFQNSVVPTIRVENVKVVG